MYTTHYTIPFVSMTADWTISQYLYDLKIYNNFVILTNQTGTEMLMPDLDYILWFLVVCVQVKCVSVCAYMRVWKIR